MIREATLESNTAKKLEALDLIKLYGVMDYQWNLQTDSIDWRGPISKLLSPETPLSLGSSFHNILDTENFWRRLEALTHASPSSPQFEVRYNLCFPNYLQCPVEEKGEIIYNEEGTPLMIQGAVKFLDDPLEKSLPKNLSGYDPLTGFSGKDVLLETLTAHLDESQQSGTPSAYITVAIDRLSLFACLHGLKATAALIKKVADALRKAMRFNDFMGRTSGCCFGIVLKECDRWGIIRAADRLISHVEKTKLTLDNGTEVQGTISLGGLVFPGETLEPQKVMQRAERYLFEAQIVKGSNIAGTPYGPQTKPELSRPMETVLGKRRAKDVHPISKKEVKNATS